MYYVDVYMCREGRHVGGNMEVCVCREGRHVGVNMEVGV